MLTSFGSEKLLAQKMLTLKNKVVKKIPKDSENLKSLDIGLWELGAKRLLDGVNK